MSDDFTPRHYQVELMKIAMEKNSIIFLPTGSGKTFIALMVLKEMSAALMQKYSTGGKISIILVNNVALVDQHAKNVINHTNFTVGQYTGEMNLDFWPKEKWYEEYDKHQVLIMTSQILNNIINQHFIDLNKINVLIFDECHHAVNDHPMRIIMKSFNGLKDPPRVIGLTATLLNRNCTANKVLQEVQALETTFHGQVATVNGLSEVIGYSTNPKEDFVPYAENNPTFMERNVINVIERMIEVVKIFKVEQTVYSLPNYQPLNGSVGNKELINMLDEIILHIREFGMYGAIKAALSYMIQLECLKKRCQDLNTLALINCLVSNLSFIKQMLSHFIKSYEEKEQIKQFSSDKLIKLFDIFKNYRTEPKEELCAIVFTKRRFTAKIIYHILNSLSQCDPEFAFLKPDFIVGFSNNPYNNTRENLFVTKKNKEVINSFRNKDINCLVSSSVLEEGIDIQKCTLVVRFDLPEDYRSYVQSKGRARHKESLFYMLIQHNTFDKYITKYKDFRTVEDVLNDYLVGKNNEREGVTSEAIEKMYAENVIPPYYVNGVNSAFVDMHSAIPLLCQYCSSFPSDIYTTYAPEWYIDRKTDSAGKEKVAVVILLPIVSPLREIIQGDYMVTIKNAKRAAALKACIQLHKMGELDDHLLPKKEVLCDEDVGFLFQHYPKEKRKKLLEPIRKLHPVQIAKCLKGSIHQGVKCYLHVINLTPTFRRPDDMEDIALYDVYTSSTCFGLLTPHVIPKIPQFSLYVTLGSIVVDVKINQKEYSLEKTDIDQIKHFHFTIFDEVLKILQRFLIFDNSAIVEGIFVVPVNKITNEIDFDILRKMFTVKVIDQLTIEEKQQLVVTPETYMRKVVEPWYRDCDPYIVANVCMDLNALSPFPNADYSNYKEYFKEKHSRLILCPNLPLLLVKGLTRRLNFLKPRTRETKRKRDKLYEEMSEHLPPELVVKQDYPSDLWIQARFLPSVLSRLSFICRVEELRCKIVSEAQLGEVIASSEVSLRPDDCLLHHEEPEEESADMKEINTVPLPSERDLNVSLVPRHINRDFAAKMLESEFPWKSMEEPQNILKTLDVSLMEIEHYEAFINLKVGTEDSYLLKNMHSNKPLQITYPKNFEPKTIRMLEDKNARQGPTLVDLFTALTCSKADEVVNLERLETLGDSFLKLITSLYITLRFPTFNEGNATQLKSRLVSNRNLYYLALTKNLDRIMKFAKLNPREDWLPPSFKVPDELSVRILRKEISINALYDFSFSSEEQMNGVLCTESLEQIMEENTVPDDKEESCYANLCSFLGFQYIGDKHISDVVESLLGCYFQTCGFQGAIKFLEWLGYFPKTEQVEHLLKQAVPNPILGNKEQKDVLFHIPQWGEIEKILGYQFKNRAYLLQALTHSSYAPNRITMSYEKLEFLGDAVLDFLITCFIYENNEKLDPGDLTDLRSALVNNNTFASLVVRNRLHKFLLMINSNLQGHIDKFVEFFKGKNYEIDNEILILLYEDELYLADYVDVPKVLGDIFESLAGAIYLDSGLNLKTVWDVYYKLMWKEIDLFSKNIPKNAVRLLFEKNELHPVFGCAQETANGKTLMPLQFRLEGKVKTVYGCGTNKIMAKKAAAKLALRCITE